MYVQLIYKLCVSCNVKGSTTSSPLSGASMMSPHDIGWTDRVGQTCTMRQVGKYLSLKMKKETELALKMCLLGHVKTLLMFEACLRPKHDTFLIG